MTSSKRTHDSQNTGKIGPEKPKRPLSAYNIFYRLSREYMMSSSSHKRGRGEDIVKSTFQDILSMDNDLLQRTATNIVNNYRSDKSTSERGAGKSKSQSFLGFQDLTRVIAKEWSKLTRKKKIVFEKCSNIDRKLYIQNTKIWQSERDIKIKRMLDAQVIDEIPSYQSSNHITDSMHSNLYNSSIHKSPHMNYLCGEDRQRFKNSFVSHNILPVSESTRLSKNAAIRTPCHQDENTLKNLRANAKISSNVPFLPQGKAVDKSLYSNSYSQDDRCNMTTSLTVYQLQPEFDELRRSLLRDIFECDRELDSFLSMIK